MSPLRFPALVCLALAVFAGCTPAPSPDASATGAMRLTVATPLAAPGDIARVTVTVTASDMEPLSAELVLAEGVWASTLGGIPAGTQRTFQAQAFTAANTLRYEGRAEGVTVLADDSGLVSLRLQEALPPAFTNEAPIIDSLVATPTRVVPGGTVSLRVSARDPNPGDALRYGWTAPAGRFSAPAQANTFWTAPSVQGPVTLVLTVSDPHEAGMTVSLPVEVSAGRGIASVKVDINTVPRVSAVTASETTLDVGQRTNLAVSATDADGDPLSYQWSATCAGAFTGATTARATFAPSALLAEACNNCQVSVRVTDGRGGQALSTLALCIARDSRQAPPRVTRSFQSSLTAQAGQQLTFEVGGSDPSGTALTFTWAVNLGAMGTAVTDAASSRITWTMPACAPSGTTPDITATITNTAGLKATRSFSVTGLPTCAP